MKAGLEEVAKNALWAVKELNRLSACKPSVPLDLVYLQDGVNITWKSVEHAAASMAKELNKTSCQKVKAAVAAYRAFGNERMEIGAEAGDGRVYRIGFLSHDLYRRSATLDLAGDTIMRLDGWKDGQFRVFVYSCGDGLDPSCQPFVEHFKAQNRFRQFAEDAQPETIIALMLPDDLDVLVHMPGFNAGKQFEVLAGRAATANVQWLGSAGPICAQTLLDYTICSRRLWSSSSSSEGAVFFDNMYPLPFTACQHEVDSLPIRDDAIAQRLGLLPGRRRLCLPGIACRLREETVIIALQILAQCGHDSESPVLYIMYNAGSQDMFASVLCWAEEWRKTHCREFDLERIRPFRFQTELTEHKALTAQMDVFFDTHPCGLHTSALEPIALCKCFVAYRRPGASWPALVACSMLEYGGYGHLVAQTEEDLISKAAMLLGSMEKTLRIEQFMREDRANNRGMFYRDRVVTNFAVGVPLIVESVNAAGGDSHPVRRRGDIDVTTSLPSMPAGGSAVTCPERPMVEAQVMRCDQLLSTIAKRTSALYQIRQVLLMAMQCGLELKVLAGTGASCHAFRGEFGKEDSRRSCILKVARCSRKIQDLATDPNFRAVVAMDAASAHSEQHAEQRFVIEAVPIFLNSRGQPCAAGYVPIEEGGGQKVITFHCCEAMPADLLDADQYQSMVAEFRERGIITTTRIRFERGMFQMLQSLRRRKLFVMDLSLGNIAVGPQGHPRVIDLGSSIVLGDGAMRSALLTAARSDSNSDPVLDRRARVTMGHAKDGVVLCTSEEVRDRVSYRGRGQYQNGFGTKTCRSEAMANELRDRFKNVPLTEDFAAHFDLSSAAMIIVQGYVPVSAGRQKWLESLDVARTSADAMYEFLCSGLEYGVQVQKPHDLRKRADILHRLLAEPWQQQPPAYEVLHALDSTTKPEQRSISRWCGQERR